MSEIDRIVESIYREVCSIEETSPQADFDAIKSMLRAALLEYGAIVREECAKWHEKEIAHIYDAMDSKQLQIDLGLAMIDAHSVSIRAIRNANLPPA